MFESGPETFDLVLTDMPVPEMTGFQLAEQLLKIRSDISIVLCTGFSLGITEKRIRNAGIKGFVMKPLVASELVAAVSSALHPVEERQEFFCLNYTA